VSTAPVSARAAVPGLVSARPLLELLPAIFHDDEFAARWLSGLDTVMAVVETTLDCFPAYLDPELSPEDFLAWTGSWLGTVFDEEMTLAQRRALVAEIVGIYGMRGTVAGIERLLELTLPVQATVVEGGGVSASDTPLGDLPGAAAAAFIVEVRPTGSPLSDHQRRRAVLIVESTRPAHLPAVVEFPEGAKES
jgi:phage tail-like protein